MEKSRSPPSFRLTSCPFCKVPLITITQVWSWALITFSLSVELDKEGTALNGRFEDVVKNLNGAVVFTTTGTYHATRIRAEP